MLSEAFSRVGGARGGTKLVYKALQFLVPIREALEAGQILI